MDTYVVDGLTRRHGVLVANDGIDLVVGRGEVFGLLGPNGAGKTTLVRQLVGLLTPHAGRITLFGQPLDRSLAGRAVAYLAQGDAALADVPVSLALSSTARLRGLRPAAARAARDAIIDELGLAAVADRAIGQLSGGERRLAAFATVLAGPRPVLVLDEPTTGLDPVARRAVWAAVARRRRDEGCTVVLVTHNVLEAESVLDRVAVLDAGRVIACGTPGALKAQVSRDVRLDLVWKSPPPLAEPAVASLAARAEIDGFRWSVRLPVDTARDTLAELTRGSAYEVLDDFTLATPSLEDVYVSLGGQARDLERGG
jgi:ABC-2 type transport system ATP-binding protein